MFVVTWWISICLAKTWKKSGFWLWCQKHWNVIGSRYISFCFSKLSIISRPLRSITLPTEGSQSSGWEPVTWITDVVSTVLMMTISSKETSANESATICKQQWNKPASLPSITELINQSTIQYMKAFTFPVINACCQFPREKKSPVQRRFSVLHLWKYHLWFVIEEDRPETEEELG